MRLLTHNFLQSTVKGTTEGYPLKIEPEELLVEASPMDKILLTNMLSKINYEALLGAFQDVTPHMSAEKAVTARKHDTDTEKVAAKDETISKDTITTAAVHKSSDPVRRIPQLPPQLDLPVEDEELLQGLHYVLFDIHVLEGYLICPDSGRRFPVKEGIPNMILHEDEL